MAKITRAGLKKIIKECLVEILVEGIDGRSGELLEESLVASKSVIPKSNRKDLMSEIQKRRDLLDSRRVNAEPKQAVSDQVIDNLTDNSVMAEIFRDTAKTTMMEQVESRPGRNAYVPADGAAKVMQEHDPSDIFAGANNWAALAFSDGNSTKQ